MPLRVILMYISEVSGHHSATLAIEKAIKGLSPDAEILNINAFNYTNPIAEKVTNRIYMGVIKATPGIWEYLYDNPSIAKRIAKLKSRVHKMNSPKFKALFDKFKPDIVACTQAFPCGMVADFKSAYSSDLPLIGILTDYIPHAYWVYDTINYYVAPSEEVASRLAKKGVDIKKIHSLGIPFDPGFTQPVIREQSAVRLGLDPRVPTVLIMGGGQGLGPIKTIVRRLEKCKGLIQEIVVCGTNRKLYNSLKKKIPKYKKRILLYGYADNMNELMGISDIVITKPGGITTAEALAKKLAMIIIKPIPGQEANNTAYLTQEGAAIKADSANDIHIVIDSLIQDHGRLKALREAAGRIGKPNASFDIARLIVQAAKK